MKEYRVLSQKDKWFSAKFDPAALESAINTLAREGWEVKAAFSAQIPSFGGAREEAIILMEREAN